MIQLCLSRDLRWGWLEDIMSIILDPTGGAKQLDIQDSLKVSDTVR